jgi:hypothetical protein
MKITVKVEGKTYDLDDMQSWYVQIRGFPWMLYFGKGKNQISGGGQGGGRYASSIAKEAENKFVAKMGITAYQKAIDKIMERKGQVRRS